MPDLIVRRYSRDDNRNLSKEDKTMRKILSKALFLSLISLVITIGTMAQTQTRAYQVSDRQVQTLLNRIETRTDAFRNEIERSIDYRNNDREDSINRMIANFENATDELKNNFSSRRSTSDDVQEVLNRAVQVNTFMLNNRMSATAESQWNLIRADINTLSGYYRVRSDWNSNQNYPGSQTGSYYVSDAQLRTLLNRLNQRTISFRTSFNNWDRVNRRYQERQESDVSQDVSTFAAAVNNLRQYYSDRNSVNADIGQVLRPSVSINSFLGSNRTNSTITNRWNLVRSDLNTLASYYRLSWDWNNPVFPGSTNPNNQYGDFDSRLTGSWRLNTAQSDNVANTVEQAIVNADYNNSQRDRARVNLERRLRSPETLSFEKRGRQLTMSSANAASVSLEVDGRTRTETSPNGRRVSVNVTATDRELTINYEGDRVNDYYVSFAPVNNGQLRVTRRIYLENQERTVTVTSVYDRISNNPQWNTTAYPTVSDNYRTEGFLIPNNTRMTARLETPLSTKSINNGDRFSMIVTSPSQYSGAVIEGSVVGERSGVVSGRANLGLNFETIRLRDGRTYGFAGIVDQVREPNGNVVNVNNEGVIRDGNQTTKTVTRAGIGAVLGAIIGAIVDGGSGAAIGAGIGAGAGAGTVILQGRDNLELSSGTEFNLTAMAPTTVSSR